MFTLVHSIFTLLPLAITLYFLPRIRQLVSRPNFVLEITNRNFELLIFDYFPAIVVRFFWSCFMIFFSCREKLEHDMLNSKLWKILFHPKILFLKRCSRSNFQTWPTGTFCPDSKSMSSSRVAVCQWTPGNVECVSRYSASGHLQKFAADLILSTPQISQPCKIVTISLNSNQNLHLPAPWIPALEPNH